MVVPGLAENQPSCLRLCVCVCAGHAFSTQMEEKERERNAGKKLPEGLVFKNALSGNDNLSDSCGIHNLE